MAIYTSKFTQPEIDAGIDKANSAYQKPPTGIPASDIASGVIPTSLPASDVSAWAKQSSKPSYTKSEVGLGNVDNTADANKSVNYANSAGSAPASDVYSWAKAASKPSYGYSEIGYAVNAVTSAGGTLSLDGTTPLHVVTLTGNVSALTLSANPPAGHSCHVIFTAASEYTVVIAHDATNRVCPEATDVNLTVKANGYVEIDLLNANSKIYVRGV